MYIVDDINEFILMNEARKNYLKCIKESYFKSYKEIIKRTADLCYELKLDDNTFDISIFFEYLLWCGYLSINHKLSFCASDIVNNMACNGADIMRGKSICMSNSEMLKRLYRELGFESYLIGAYIPDKVATEKHHVLKLKRDYIKCEEDINIFNKLFEYYTVRVIGNHAITLVRNGESFEGYDSTNVVPVIIYPDLTGKWVGGHTHFPLRFSVMSIDPLIDKSNINEVKKEIKKQDEYYYPLTKLKEEEVYLLSYMKMNEKILEEFHEDIEDDINKVAYTLRK